MSGGDIVLYSRSCLVAVVKPSEVASVRSVDRLGGKTAMNRDHHRRPKQRTHLLSRLSLNIVGPGCLARALRGVTF